MTDQEFVEAFERCAIAGDSFHHRDHVRLAWVYLRDMPLLDSLKRFTESLKRFAAHNGVPNLYHETITWAYLLALNERLERKGRQRSWAEFARDHGELFAPDFLHAYYAPATLASPLAKRVFVFPDA